MKERTKLLQKPWFSPDATREIRALDPVLREVRTVHKSYINNEPNEEISYWHGERPHTGLLAAAVWRCRGLTALEEYATRRRVGPKKVTGRCDLYIRVARDLTFECEAKHLSVNLRTRARESADDVLRCLKQAMKQAKQVKGAKSRKEAAVLNRTDHYLGICFVTSTIKQPKSGEPEAKTLELINELKQGDGRSRCDGLFWIHGKPLPDSERPAWFYPGLLIAIQELRE